MERFTKHSGSPVAIDRANIDTDQIIPKQFLKRIERTGYGRFLFYDWRYAPDGIPNANFPLNDPKYQEASILIAGANFGCGSSREHAPWSLYDYGFRAVIAPSFADIFYNNSLKNGLLPIPLSDERVTELADRSLQSSYQISIDLEKQSVTDSEDTVSFFEIDPFRKHCLLNGLDDIGLTLQHEAKIAAYESRRSAAPRF